MGNKLHLAKAPAAAKPAAPAAAPQPAAPAATPAAAPAAKPAAPVVRTMRAVPGTLNVLKQAQPYKGARGAWYKVLLQHNGQPAQAYLDHCLATPPSLPASKRAEPPSGWLSWFVRQGVVVVVPPAAQPAPTVPPAP